VKEQPADKLFARFVEAKERPRRILQPRVNGEYVLHRREGLASDSGASQFNHFRNGCDFAGISHS
jgi:hypothetical protein